ncbi:MAG: peroxiredoxin [Thermoprotei archaeon]|nr:peroxiredoxin [Thermoprotei archaeon]
MVNAGDKAPDFEGLDNSGKPLRLSSLKGATIVLYFYPKAMTGGCTREGIRFNELYEEFKNLGVEIIGVSTDPLDDNRRFAEKYGFKFRLVSDEDRVISRAYGVLNSETMRAERVTFIIDRDGVVKAVLRNIRPAERHADEALKIAREIASKG